jgi:hypothetical protein
LSPNVLIELLEAADRQFAEFMNSLDPQGEAIFPVAWAGEESSRNWFDVARDYTEKWHHTQQIFDAVERPSTIMTARLYHPCLQVFMRALPFTFRDVDAADGTSVAVDVTGEAGGVWQLVHRGGAWEWHEQPRPGELTDATRVVLPEQDAWKVLTKRRSYEAVLKQFPEITIDGDQQLGHRVLEMVSVMA